MKDLYACFYQLDNTTKTSKKTEILLHYFNNASKPDLAWAIYFFLGKRISRVIPVAMMKAVAQKLAGIDQWLFQLCYQRVGDLSETISLIIPPNENAYDSKSLSQVIEDWILPLKQLPADKKSDFLMDIYQQLNKESLFIFNKLITGGFRLGVSKGMVLKVLAEWTSLEQTLLAQRLMGEWQPGAEFIDSLCQPVNLEDDITTTVYPFMLSNPLDNEPTDLGKESDWQVEWKWDGIRAQLIIDPNQCQLWSRGEEIIGDKFPEIMACAQKMEKPCVLDGEIIPFKEHVLTFHQLQRRLNRKHVTKNLLTEVPCIFYAFDLLNLNQKDLREMPLFQRRHHLTSLLNPKSNIRPCPVFERMSWQSLQQMKDNARHYHAEGLMLKHKHAPYVMGRKRGFWWKWKVDPMTIDGVLVQAQAGHGRRAGVYSDYTFAVWSDNQLVPFAKAYSGLTDDEMQQVSQYVKRSIIDKFGPVVVVEPQLVFEIAFENIQPSKRHKAGVAVRFPRILRPRFDKSVAQANTLNDLKSLLKLYEYKDS